MDGTGNVSKGFLKGVGKGVAGLVASPFTAVFRLTSNVFTGLQEQT